MDLVDDINNRSRFGYRLSYGYNLNKDDEDLSDISPAERNGRVPVCYQNPKISHEARMERYNIKRLNEQKDQS